jgi:hypothetical protein
MSMVEQVAQAIEMAGSRLLSGENRKMHFERVARAAIEAMRDPTGPMLTAGRINLGGTDELHVDEAQEAWCRMIDAALSDGQSAVRSDE